MISRLKASFTAMSTALLLSAIALPVSVIAFAVLYAYSDSFWTVLWLGVVLPTIWVTAFALAMLDALRRRSWRQLGGVLALLAPTVLLFAVVSTPRFAFHQLFTFRPLDLGLPTSGVLYIEKFAVCGQKAPCNTHSGVTETQNFKLNYIPQGCCRLTVLNGQAGKHMVKTFHVALNGKEVELPAGGPVRNAPVKLNAENEISVQLNGASDSYLYVVLYYSGKKDASPS